MTRRRSRSQRHEPFVFIASIVASIAPACGGGQHPAPQPAPGGTLPAAAIRDAIGSHLAEVHACHEAVLERAPTAVGQVTVHFVIAMDGSVHNVTSENSAGTFPGLETCVTGLMTNWQFPAPTGGPVAVTYPFSFTVADVPDQPGAVPATEIRRVVHGSLASIQHCYEQGLTASPAMSGRVLLRFTIGPDGAVSEATIAENHLGSDSVGVCIAGLARAWHFAAPANHSPMTVSYPFNFAADSYEPASVATLDRDAAATASASVANTAESPDAGLTGRSADTITTDDAGRRIYNVNGPIEINGDTDASAAPDAGAHAHHHATHH